MEMGTKMWVTWSVQSILNFGSQPAAEDYTETVFEMVKFDMSKISIFLSA